MKALRILFLIYGLAILIFSCKKDHRVLGSVVQPENDELETLPGLRYPAYVHTIYHDAIVSLNTNIKFIGSNTDGNYGTTTIGLYTNLNTSGSINFGSDAVLTKAELVLAIAEQELENAITCRENTNFNGIDTDVLTYSVFPIDTLLSNKRSYFNNNKNLHNPNILISHAQTTPEKKDLPNLIRLPVDSLFAAGMLLDSVNLKDPLKFMSAYKGFYILASNGGKTGAIFKCDLDNSKSGLFMYYRLPGDTSDRNYQFTFSGVNSVKFNTLTYEAGPGISSQLGGDTTQGAQVNYLRGMGATKMKLQIPFLKNRSDSFNYAVNRAEVLIHLDPSTIPDKKNYEPPIRICLMASDSLGAEKLCNDQLNSTYAVRYDGSYDCDRKCYVFNIPLQAQQILNGTKKNYGFYVVMASPVYPNTARRDNYFQRLVLLGHGSASPPEFNISYTRVAKN